MILCVVCNKKLPSVHIARFDAIVTTHGVCKLCVLDELIADAMKEVAKRKAAAS